MKFKLLWNKRLHQKVNSRAILIDDNSIYVAERENYITKIHIVSPETIWSTKISNTWGWLSIFKSNLYYIEQSGNLFIMKKETGEIVKNSQ